MDNFIDKDDYSNNLDTDDDINISSSDDKEINSKGSKIFNEFCDMVESVLFSIFTVILIFTFLFKVASVIGSSMVPTLEEGDKLIVSSAFYNQPEQSDVVIIDAENAHLLVDSDSDGQVDDVEISNGLQKPIVKRVIAVEGQTVDIDFENGNVYIDGEIINEPYINNLTTNDEYAFQYPITIPEGYIFVLGDNRIVSKDSRHPEVGLVDIDYVIGKVVLRISPLEKFGFID